MTVVSLRRALLRWYEPRRQSFPWRQTSCSYQIWISEIMLQQTRIATVLPAYERFIERFPTLAELARADIDEVLSLWSGLGYYSRARSLHKAARVLSDAGETAFPREVESALALPGVGAYTAAAVLSIAYGARLAAIDGNVVRVVSRLRRLAAPNASGEPQRSVAEELLSRTRPGDWNQAMMELGQTHCTPRRPSCGDCPIRSGCEAALHDDVGRFPVSRPRPAIELVPVSMGLVHDGRGHLLLERGRFPHLKEFWLPIFGEPTVVRMTTSAIGEFRHAIMQRQFHVSLWAGRARRPAKAPARVDDLGGERCWLARDDLMRLGRSSLLTKALRKFDAHDDV